MESTRFVPVIAELLLFICSLPIYAIGNAIVDVPAPHTLSLLPVGPVEPTRVGSQLAMRRGVVRVAAFLLAFPEALAHEHFCSPHPSVVHSQCCLVYHSAWRRATRLIMHHRSQPHYYPYDPALPPRTLRPTFAECAAGVNW